MIAKSRTKPPTIPVTKAMTRVWLEPVDAAPTAVDVGAAAAVDEDEVAAAAWENDDGDEDTPWLDIGEVEIGEVVGDKEGVAEGAEVRAVDGAGICDAGDVRPPYTHAPSVPRGI
jgi:hypothetical protein